MRAAAILGLILLAALPAAAGSETVTAAYALNPTPGLVRLVGGSVAGVGGAVFLTHPHDTTASVSVTDGVNGAITALICQDLSNDRVCSTLAGSADRWACAWGGALSGFPVQSAYASNQLLMVLVAAPGTTLEGCNVTGAATAGTITVTYG